MAKKKRVRVPKKPRTGALPGMENKGIVDIERAARAYVEARDARMQLNEVEKKKHDLVLAAMKRHGKKTYKHNTGDEIVEVVVHPKDASEKATVKVKTAADEVD